MNIVLLNPEIPYNTGNIGRSAVLTNTTLHLIKPLGFSLDEKQLRRAGLDYWHLVDIHYYDSVYEVLEKYKDNPKYFLTTKAHSSYADVQYAQDSLLIFGKETAGLPEPLLHEYPESCIRIPMIEDARSLNLSNSVAIVAYEALRQNGFADLTLYGGEYK